MKTLSFILCLAALVAAGHCRAEATATPSPTITPTPYYVKVLASRASGRLEPVVKIGSVEAAFFYTEDERFCIVAIYGGDPADIALIVSAGIRTNELEAEMSNTAAQVATITPTPTPRK